MSDAKAKMKSEKFPPPHQDGAVGYRSNSSQNGLLSFSAIDTSSKSSIFNPNSSRSLRNGTSSNEASRKHTNEEHRRAPTRRFMHAFYPSSVNWSGDFRFWRR